MKKIKLKNKKTGKVITIKKEEQPKPDYKKDYKMA